MYPAPIAWLDEVVGLPRSLKEALWTGPVWVDPQAKDLALDRKAWLAEVLAAAGKLMIIREPVETAGGITLVSDLRLVRQDAVHRYELAPGPDLSEGARRLKEITKFDPTAPLIHPESNQQEAEEPWIGDVITSGGVSGIVVGTHGGKVLAIVGPGCETAELGLKGATVRRVPYTNDGHMTARHFELDREWQPNRENHPDIWDMDALATEGYRELDPASEVDSDGNTSAPVGD
jgi:hypothetical protein